MLLENYMGLHIKAKYSRSVAQYGVRSSPLLFRFMVLGGPLTPSKPQSRPLYVEVMKHLLHVCEALGKCLDSSKLLGTEPSIIILLCEPQVR